MTALIIQRTILGLLAAACFSLFVGCSSSRPAPQTPEPAAPSIQVDGDSLPPFSFAKVVLDIPIHRPIGYHFEGMEYTRESEYWWGPGVEDETDVLHQECQDIFEKAGYRVAPLGDPESIILVGTMRKFSFNSYAYKSSFQQVELEMRWALYRDGEKKLFFTKDTSGSGRKEMDQPGTIIAAYELALHRLLADEAMVAAVAGD